MKIDVGNISDLIKEDSGKLSSMRVLVYLIVSVVLFNWTWFNINHDTIANFDWQEIGLIVGTLWVKAHQKGNENNG